MKLVLPLILGVAGLAGGAGAGFFLKPAAAPAAEAADPHAAPAEPGAESGHGAEPAESHEAGGHDAGGHGGEGEAPLHDYVKLNNQFLVPVVERGEIVSLVVLSLSLEAAPGSTEAVYAREPKLRDAFLQVLFAHANAGGFNGAFTEAAPMDGLRTALREAATKVLGDTVTDVLIIDLVRQDS